MFFLKGIITKSKKYRTELLMLKDKYLISNVSIPTGLTNFVLIEFYYKSIFQFVKVYSDTMIIIERVVGVVTKSAVQLLVV